MRTLRAWVWRLTSLFAESRRNGDFQQELETHLQLHIDDNIRSGMSPAEARRVAVLRLGGIEAVKERQRDRRGVPLLQHLWRDVRYGVRVLRRSRTFSVIAIVTLALGIGANTSIFTLVNAILLRPLPYDDPDRLVLVWSTEASSGNREMSVSYPDFELWRGETRSFETVAAVTTRPVTLGGGAQPELVPAIQTTPAFFSVLGVAALAGRVFADVDAAPDAPPTAVLSEAAWKRQFAAADIVGATVTVNQRPHVVIGVVPAAAHFLPTEVEQVYTLLPRESDRRHAYLRVVARLGPGATLEGAQAELDVLVRRTAAEFPRTHANAGVNVVSLAAAAGAPVRDVLIVLLSLVGVVLLIACTNVANLLLARYASRQHEIALRVSLGAGRTRILQQLVIESLLLALAGGAAGLLVAQVLTDGLLAMVGDAVPLPRVENIRIDVVVLGFAFLVSIATGLLFGLGPAMVAAGRLSVSTHAAGRTVAGTGQGRRTRATLIVIETALALVLLAAGAMLGRSFLELRATWPGFVSEGVLAMGIRLPPALAPGSRRESFFEDVRARLQSMPGVASAGFVSSLPMSGNRDSLQFRLADQPASKPASANFNIASPAYFRTMGIPVTAGREFTPGDHASAPGAIVINETAARRFWPGSDPLGRRIIVSGSPVSLTVVGVTADVRQSDLGTASRAEIFLCALQTGPAWPMFALVVKTSSNPLSLVADVRATVQAVDPEVAVARVAAMEDVVAGRLAQPRIVTTLLGAFAVVALVLAAVGLYGVIAYSVTQRTREFGIRLALGSTPAALVGSVLKVGAALSAVGILAGLAGAYAATQFIARLLPLARGGDPLTLMAVAAVMLVVGLAASYLPARRAARVDPLVALRAE